TDARLLVEEGVCCAHTELIQFRRTLNLCVHDRRNACSFSRIYAEAVNIWPAVAISDKTRKLLWGRSGNRCAICRRTLSVDGTVVDAEAVVGEECHIVSGRR